MEGHSRKVHKWNQLQDNVPPYTAQPIVNQFSHSFIVHTVFTNSDLIDQHEILLFLQHPPLKHYVHPNSIKKYIKNDIKKTIT